MLRILRSQTFRILLFLLGVDVVATISAHSIAFFSPWIYALAVGTSACLWAAIEITTARLPLRAARGIAMVIGLLLGMATTVSLLLHAEFGEYLSAPQIVAYGSSFLDYLGARSSRSAYPFIAVVAVICGSIWWPKRDRRSWNGSAAITVVVLVATFLVLLNQLRVLAVNRRTPVDVSTLLAFKAALRSDGHVRGLRSSVRLTVPAIAADEAAAPPNILLIINDSLNRTGVPGFPGASGMPRLSRWMESEPDTFLRFTSAFANGTYTEVSLPTIFTSLRGDRPIEDFHSVPLLWHWAAARGMRTLLVSSQQYRFSNIHSFLSTPAPDVYLTSDELRLPLINGLGGDDVLAARALASQIESIDSQTSFLAVFHDNSMHVPLQQTSDALPVQPNAGSSWFNALEILDQSLETLRSGLERSGRLENTIVIITSDHGSTVRESHDIARAMNFYDDVVRVPLLVRLPPKWAARHPEFAGALRNNTRVTVSNLDLLPTIVDALGGTLTTAHRALTARFDGASLLRPVQEDRLIATMNSTEFRVDEHAGVGLIRGSLRFMHSDTAGTTLYDTQTDPEEIHDLWPSSPDDVRRDFLATICSSRTLTRIYDAKPGR